MAQAVWTKHLRFSCLTVFSSNNVLNRARNRLVAHGSVDFSGYLQTSVASPFPFLLASRLLSSLDLRCLCFCLLTCKGEGGEGWGDNIHDNIRANAACI